MQNNDSLFRGIDPEYPGNPFPFMRERIQDDKGFFAMFDQTNERAENTLTRYAKRNIQHLTQEKTKLHHMMHQLSEKIMSSPAFNDKRVVAAVISRYALGRYVNGLPTTHYLWRQRNIVPIVSIDEGFSDVGHHNAKTLISRDLDEVLSGCIKHNVFGVKLTARVGSVDSPAFEELLAHQLFYVDEITSYGLIPVLSFQWKIKHIDPTVAEPIFVRQLDSMLDSIGDRSVVLQLPLPITPNVYEALINHPNTLRIVCGDGTGEPNTAVNQLRMNPYISSSLTDALFQGLYANSDQHIFESTLNSNIASLYNASIHGMSTQEGIV
jgi:fructose-bisphosphate aldolase class I